VQARLCRDLLGAIGERARERGKEISCFHFATLAYPFVHAAHGNNGAASAASNLMTTCCCCMAAAVDWRFDRRLARFAEVILWKASIKMLFLMEISSYCCGWLAGRQRIAAASSL
jgi:hypothetical protein